MVLPCECPCEPCNVNPPCTPCECLLECPENCAEDPVPDTCCELVKKPKKTIWERLFGERKCNMCCKKKQFCICKRKKKQTCKPIVDLCNAVCGENDRKQYLAQNCNLANCKCKAYTCPKKCCLPTQRSLCGCHLYFNVNKLPKRRTYFTNSNIRSSTVCEQDVNTGIRAGCSRQDPDNDVDEAPPRQLENNRGFRYSAAKRKNNSLLPSDENRYSVASTYSPENNKKCSTVCDQRKPSLKAELVEKRKNSQETDQPNDANIRFGVTFTKDETLYFKPNKGELLRVAKEENDEICIEGENMSIRNIDQMGSNNSDKVMKFEVNNQTENKKQPQLSFNIGFSKHNSFPKSESLSREVDPLLRKRVSMSHKAYCGPARDVGSFDGGCFPETDQNELQKGNLTSLDRRICEILRKLCKIEKKISNMEQKDQKDITIDFNGQKSSVSLHLRDRQLNKADGHCTTNSSLSGVKNGTAVIKIKHTRSRTCQPVENCRPPGLISTCSETLDVCNTTERTKRIVIKIPNTSNDCPIFCTDENGDSEPNEECCRPVSWCEVSNNLKCPTEVKCYCYDCMCKRNRSR